MQPSNSGSLFSRRRPTRGRHGFAAWAGAGMLGCASLLVALTPGSAQAAGLPPSLAQFANCPVNVKHVSLCLYSTTTSTTFQIGSTVVPSTQPTTVSLGLIQSKSGIEVVLPDNGTQALQAPAIPLPGGLLGIPGLGGGLLSVTVTPQLVGLPSLSLANLLSGSGPGLTLPIDVLLSTPLGILGPDCTIGDSSDPITLNLTTGTTNPPPPNTPETGSVGTSSSSPTGEITITGMTLLDNTFAVPGADNCGLFGILDPILDLDKGLPSPAGSNNAVLSGSSYLAPASLIKKYLH
jgi:hypothetical protein